MNKYLQEKIKTLEALVDMRENWRQAGKVLVTNNGSYDILHYGHIEGLLNAKEQGDVLIIGLNSDRSIKAYKSPDRPINPEHARQAMLAALECVDYVFCFEETTPLQWLGKLKPDIHTNGAEYGKNCIEREVVEANGGKIYLLPMIEGFSTTKILKKTIEPSSPQR